MVHLGTAEDVDGINVLSFHCGQGIAASFLKTEPAPRQGCPLRLKITYKSQFDIAVIAQTRKNGEMQVCRSRPCANHKYA
jgi:hypothetical protein